MLCQLNKCGSRLVHGLFSVEFFFFVWRIAKIVEFSWWRTVEFYINMDYAHEKVSNHYFVFIYLFYLLWVKFCFAVVLWWIWLTKKLSKFFLYMDRRVYLRVCKRLLTEQQRRRKKIKFFFLECIKHLRRNKGKRKQSG